jgi:hypothetical protein
MLQYCLKLEQQQAALRQLAPLLHHLQSAFCEGLPPLGQLQVELEVPH